MDLKLTQRVTQAVEAVRVWLPAVPYHAREFAVQFRADPMAMLRTPGARVAIISCVGFVLVLTIYSVGEWIAPSDDMGDVAETVSVRVRCVNAKCEWKKGNHTCKVDVDFDDWPTECPKCEQDTLYPVLRCHNSKCRKWVVPRIQQDGTKRCPRCGVPM